MLYEVVVNEWEETTYVPTTPGKILLAVIFILLLCGAVRRGRCMSCLLTNIECIAAIVKRTRTEPEKADAGNGLQVEQGEADVRNGRRCRWRRKMRTRRTAGTGAGGIWNET